MPSQRKVVLSSKNGINSFASLHANLQELHRTNEPKAEQIRATCLGYTAQTIYLLGPEPRAALDTVIHSAGRYSEESSRIHRGINTSLSNLVRSIQIRHRIMLKLQTSEQTPLLWKPGETLFNKHITTIHHGFNIVSLQEQLVAVV